MKCKLLVLCLFTFFLAQSQQKQIDSLKLDINKTKVDSLKVKSLYRIASYYIKLEDSINASNSYISGIKLAKQIKKHFWVVYGLNELGYLLEITDNPKAALNHYNEAVSYGRKYFILGERARAFSNLSFVYTSLFEVNKSIEAIDSALSIYRVLGMKQNVAANLNNLGTKYFELGNFEKAIEYYNESAVICEEIQKPITLANAYMNIGNVYIEMKNMDIGISYFNKSKKIFEEQRDLKNVTLVNYNTAKAFHDKKDYRNAILILEKNIEIAEKVKPKKLYNNFLNLLATCYSKLKNLEKSSIYFNKALVEMRKEDNKEGILVNYSNYAAFLAENGNSDSALFYSNQAKNLGYSYLELKKFLPQIFETIALCNLKKGNFKDAFNYQDSQFIYKEQLINETSNNKLLELQTKYETQQKENKILILNKSDSLKTLQLVAQQLAISKNLYQLSQQKFALTNAKLQLAEDSIMLFSQNQTILQNQLDSSIKEEKINTLTKAGLQKELALQKQQASINQKNNTIIIVAISSALLLLLGYGLFRKKQLEQKAILISEKAKQREQLTKAIIDAEEAERKRIAADLHDGVGQLFSAVKMNLNGLLDRVEITKDDDKFLAEKTMALVDESCKEVRVISHKMMPNFLLKSGIASDIRSFIEKIDEHTLKINFETKGFSEQLEFNEEVILYRVIQELINNVIKHAQANALNLVLEKNDKQIKVVVADNGKGFNYEAAIAKGGLGLKNMLVRIEYLKGTIEFLNNKPTGTLVQIHIPLV